MRQKPQRELDMTLDAVSENERFARVAVCAFITPLDPTLPELADVRTAVSEAVTNCVVHAYRETKGKIYINVRYYPDKTVKIRIKDKGCGIADIQKCREPLYTTDPSGERGGMGFAIMESFTDRMSVSSKVGKGTVLTLYKKLS